MRAHALVDALVARADQHQVRLRGELAGERLVEGAAARVEQDARGLALGRRHGAPARRRSVRAAGPCRLRRRRGSRPRCDGGRCPTRAGRGHAARRGRGPGHGRGWIPPAGPGSSAGKRVMTSIRRLIRRRAGSGTSAACPWCSARRRSLPLWLGRGRRPRRELLALRAIVRGPLAFGAGASSSSPSASASTTMRPSRGASSRTTALTAGTYNSPRGPPRDHEDLGLRRPGRRLPRCRAPRRQWSPPARR